MTTYDYFFGIFILSVLVFVPLTLVNFFKQAQKCYDACNAIEKEILEADANDYDIAVNIFNKILNAQKLSFEKNTNNKIRSTYNMWKGKFHFIVTQNA
jgi:hypothetical protein